MLAVSQDSKAFGRISFCQCGCRFAMTVVVDMVCLYFCYPYNPGRDITIWMWFLFLGEINLVSLTYPLYKHIQIRRKNTDQDDLDFQVRQGQVIWYIQLSTKAQKAYLWQETLVGDSNISWQYVWGRHVACMQHGHLKVQRQHESLHW